MPAWLIPVTMAAMAGVNAIGSARSGRKQRAHERNINQQNINLAREQMRWNEAMWDKQNVYNTPTEQMKRLQAAGLNPRLVYGQSSGGAAGHADQVRGYDRADVKTNMAGQDVFGDFVGNLEHMSRTAGVADQMRNSSVGRQNAAAQTLNLIAETEGKRLENIVKEGTTQPRISKAWHESDIAEHNASAASEIARKAAHDANIYAIEEKVKELTSDAQIMSVFQDLRKKIIENKGRSLDNQAKNARLEVAKLEGLLAARGLTLSDDVVWRALASENYDVAAASGGVAFLKKLLHLAGMVTPHGRAISMARRLPRAKF